MERFHSHITREMKKLFPMKIKLMMKSFTFQFSRNCYDYYCYVLITSEKENFPLKYIYSLSIRKQIDMQIKFCGKPINETLKFPRGRVEWKTY